MLCFLGFDGDSLRIAQDGRPRSAASHLGLYRFPMSHKYLLLLGPVSSKRLRHNFVLENVLGRFKDKNCVSSNSGNIGSSQILS